MTAKRAIIFILIGAAAMILGACNMSMAQDVTPPPGYQRQEFVEPVLLEQHPLAVPDPGAGGLIFQQSCLPCHGDAGLGDGPQSLQLPVQVAAIGTVGLANQNTPQEWFSTITNGKLDSFMPPFINSYNDQQRWDVLAYVYSLGSDAETLATGQAVFEASCSSCHGEDGTGLDDATDLTDQELMAAISGEAIIQSITPETAPSYHSEVDTAITPVEQVALSQYIRTFTFPTISAEDFEAYLAENLNSEDELDLDLSPDEDDSQTDTPTADDGSESDLAAGNVSGQVVNASGGEVPSGMEVTLLGFNHFDQVFEETSQADAQGNFNFTELELAEGIIVYAETEYGGTVYRSAFSVLEAGQEAVDGLRLEIFETTSDPSDMAALRLLIIVEVLEGGQLQVVQWFEMLNTGDLALAPSDESTPALRFDLPEGIDTNTLVFQDGALGERYVLTDNGFGDTNVYIPNSDTADVVFAYEMLLDGELVLSQEMDWPVMQTLILTPDEELTITDETAVDLGTQDLEGTVFRAYDMGPVMAGGTLEATIQGRSPLAIFFENLQTDAIGILLGVVGLALVILRASAWFRGSGRGEGDSAEDIMDMIIDLDEEYEAGEIGEKEYKQERAELKDELRKLID